MTTVQSPPNDRLIRVEEAAVLLGVEPPTLYAWRARNKGPVSFRVLGKVVYQQQPLLEWLARQQAATCRGESVA